MMKAVRLYGPHNLKIEDIPEPPAPPSDDVVIRVKAVGICGSDLHAYEAGRIGDTIYEDGAILGHEFMGEVVAVGANALDGNHEPLKAGQRVAIDPETPCYRCEMCETGHPNLCPHHTFYGSYPTDGAMQEYMTVHARNCFPMPDSISDGGGALLETLGVAIHAVDLAKLKVAKSVAILGAGPVGLLILRLAKLAGAAPVYAFDKFHWRVDKALAWGADGAWVVDDDDPVERINFATKGRGVDVVFEAAWSDHSVQQAADMVRYGGRMMLVGIPNDDRLSVSHSVVRRKGLTMVIVRRMKHTYPRAIQLGTWGRDKLDLDDLISHHLPLTQAAEGFRMNAAYEEGVHKIILDV